MKDPYKIPRSFPAHIDALFPPNMTSLVHPDFVSWNPQRTILDYDGLWFHPRQEGFDTNSRPTGHEVHRELIRTGKLHRCFGLQAMSFLLRTPTWIPKEWIDLGICALAWASAAYNTDGDMCVPGLYCRGDTPHIRWVPLAFRMNGAEGTPLISP